MRNHGSFPVTTHRGVTNQLKKSVAIATGAVSG